MEKWVKLTQQQSQKVDLRILEPQNEEKFTVCRFGHIKDTKRHGSFEAAFKTACASSGIRYISLRTRLRS